MYYPESFSQSAEIARYSDDVAGVTMFRKGGVETEYPSICRRFHG